MLILFSAAIFVIPSQNIAQAQSGSVRNVYFCINRDSGQSQKAYLVTTLATPQCPASPWYSYNASSSEVGFCINSQAPFNATHPNVSGTTIDQSGTRCIVTQADGTQAAEPFVTFASITTQYNPSGGGTNTNTNTNTNGGGGGTTGGTGGTSGTPPPSGGCETGFHKLGPLCVPNSPFNNNNSFAGETTVGGLAARVVRILLYFAGIVAVVMAIVGGYQIMTAGGNEAQATTGRKTLTNAIIGLVIVILSFIIIQSVISFITK